MRATTPQQNSKKRKWVSDRNAHTHSRTQRMQRMQRMPTLPILRWNLRSPPLHMSITKYKFFSLWKAYFSPNTNGDRIFDRIFFSFTTIHSDLLFLTYKNAGNGN